MQLTCNGQNVGVCLYLTPIFIQSHNPMFPSLDSVDRGSIEVKPENIIQNQQLITLTPMDS